MPEQTLKAYQVGDYDIVAAYDEAGRSASRPSCS